MNPYLLCGLSFGALLTLVNVVVAARKKQKPVLSDAVELIISAVGASGGVKLCALILTSRLTDALKSTPVPLSEDDQLYIFLGGIALVWVSFDTIIRKFR